MSAGDPSGRELGPVPIVRRGLGRGPLSRRAFIGAAGATFGGLYLAACGGSDQALPPAPTSNGKPGEIPAGVPGPQPVRGGTYGGYVITSWTEEGNSFDAAIGWDFTSWEALTQLLYAPLYAFRGQDGGPMPNAALDMPRVTNGGRLLTIELRPGVKFANGREVRAQDYKYSWERVLDPELRSWASSYLYSIEGARELYRGKARELTGVDATDPMRLKIRLTEPDETFLGILTQPYMAAVPREQVEKYGQDFGQHAMGAGPFYLQSYETGSREAVFVRNRHYMWTGLPYLDQVVFKWQLEAQLQLEQLQRDDIDMIGDGISASLVTDVNSNPTLQRYVQSVPLQANRWLSLNLTRPPLDDVRVRRALNYATDREQLSRITFGEATPWGGPLPRNLVRDAPGFTPYTFDLERARELLADANVEDASVELLVQSSSDPWPQFAQILQQQWAEIGVDVEIKQVGANAFWDITVSTEGADTDVWQDNWYYTTGSPLEVISTSWVTDGSTNYSRYSNPRVDKLTEKAIHTVDAGERGRLVEEVVAMIGNDAPAVFLQNVNYVAGRNPDLGNFHYRGEYGTYYDRLWAT